MAESIQRKQMLANWQKWTDVDLKVLDSDEFFLLERAQLTDTSLQMHFAQYAILQFYESLVIDSKKNGFSH